jgi:hypothetical protein
VSRYTIYIRDSNLERLGEVNRYSRLDLHLCFADISFWALDVPADQDIVQHFQYGNGLIVIKDGVVVFSGPILHIELNWSNSENSYILAGVDDTQLLKNHLAYPVVTGPPYSAQAYDVRTGIASTIMRQYVDYNAGPSAQAARIETGLVLAAADPLVGTTVTGRARFDNLLDLIKSLALAAGDLGYRIIQNGSQLEFQVYQPIDRTDTVIFSPKLGNLYSFGYSTDTPKANYIIAGGGGEGTARVFEENSDTDSVTTYGRIEFFRDRRDTSVVAELQQTITEELQAQGAQTTLSISPIDSPSLQFLTHYGLGDRVTVVADSRQTGQTYPLPVIIRDVVREVNISLHPDTGETVTPSIGTANSGSKDILAIFSRLGALSVRTSRLERR